jgi:rhodanese-related sulfurtransferase
MQGLTGLRERIAWRHHCVAPKLAAKLVAHGAVLVDVRDARHWGAVRVPDARHIPLAELPVRLGELPAHRPVIIVSCSGRSGRRAAAWLAHRGWHASNVTGGMHAWQRSRLPVSESGGDRCH